MKTVLKVLLLPVLLILIAVEWDARFLSGTMQVIITAIGGILLLVVIISAILSLTPILECIRNGIIVVVSVMVVNLTSAIPALLQTVRTMLTEKIIS